MAVMREARADGARQRRPNRRTDGPPWGRVVLSGVLSLVLCSFSLLTPIERGFPMLRIAGLPFRWPFLVTAALVLVMLVWDSRWSMRVLSTRYCLRHAGVMIVLVAGALRSELPATAIARVLAYLTAYVLNFVVLTWIFERGSRKTFVVVLCGVAITAAALGVAEGAFSYRPAIYGQWFANYDQAVGEFEVGLGSGYRVNGTLGNSIVYAMAMMLSLPFAAEIRSVTIRLGVCFLLLVAAAFTISKVVAVAALPMFAWVAWRLGLRRVMLWFGALVIAALAYGAVYDAGNEAFGTRLLGRWTARLTDPQVVALSTGLRSEMWLRALSPASNTGISLLVGHGLLSESTVSTAVYADLGTIDNTYLNLFYETGMVGLLAYLFAFTAPLWQLRSLAKRSIHYWAAVSLLMASFVFVSYHFYTFNFLATASMASLYVEHRKLAALERHKTLAAVGRTT